MPFRILLNHMRFSTASIAGTVSRQKADVQCSSQICCLQIQTNTTNVQLTAPAKSCVSQERGRKATEGVVMSPSMVQVGVKPEKHGDSRHKPADGQSDPVGLVPRSLFPPLQWTQEAVAKPSAWPSKETPAKSISSSS